MVSTPLRWKIMKRYTWSWWETLCDSTTRMISLAYMILKAARSADWLRDVLSTLQRWKIKTLSQISIMCKRLTCHTLILIQSTQSFARIVTFWLRSISWTIPYYSELKPKFKSIPRISIEQWAAYHSVNFRCVQPLSSKDSNGIDLPRPMVYRLITSRSLISCSSGIVIRSLSSSLKYTSCGPIESYFQPWSQSSIRPDSKDLCEVRSLLRPNRPLQVT